MTRKEKYALERKATQGWRCFYVQRESIQTIAETRVAQQEVANAVRTGDDIDVKRLKEMFLELYDKLGELCECPVCLTHMEKENTFIPTCVHLICKQCKVQITECPICRRSY